MKIISHNTSVADPGGGHALSPGLLKNSHKKDDCRTRRLIFRVSWPPSSMFLDSLLYLQESDHLHLRIIYFIIAIIVAEWNFFCDALIQLYTISANAIASCSAVMEMLPGDEIRVTGDASFPGVAVGFGFSGFSGYIVARLDV